MKYYVSLGKYKLVIQAKNSYEACVLTLQHKMDSYVEYIGRAFRISKRGFDHHADDKLVLLSTVIRMLQRKNNDLL